MAGREMAISLSCGTRSSFSLSLGLYICPRSAFGTEVAALTDVAKCPLALPPQRTPLLIGPLSYKGKADREWYQSALKGMAERQWVESEKRETYKESSQQPPL